MGERWDRFTGRLARLVKSFTPTSVIGATNVNLVIYSAVCLGILWCVSEQQRTGPLIWNQFLIATGSAAFGAMCGFVYASFGKEREDFKPVFAAINGVIGGAAITDLSKGDKSLIRAFVWSLAKSCGYGDGIGGQRGSGGGAAEVLEAGRDERRRRPRGAN